MKMHRPYVMVNHLGGSEHSYEYYALHRKLDVIVRDHKIHIGTTSHGRPGDVFVPRHDLDVRYALERAGVKYGVVRMKIEGDPDPQKFRKLFNEAVLGKQTQASRTSVQRVQPATVETLKTEMPTRQHLDVETKHAADLAEVRAVCEEAVRCYQNTSRGVSQPTLNKGGAEKMVLGVWSLLIITHFMTGVLGYLLGITL